MVILDICLDRHAVEQDTRVFISSHLYSDGGANIINNKTMLEYHKVWWQSVHEYRRESPSCIYMYCLVRSFCQHVCFACKTECFDNQVRVQIGIFSPDSVCGCGEGQPMKRAGFVSV